MSTARWRRATRRAATTALRTLGCEAPVFLWLFAGAENGRRLIVEYPELGELVSGCFGKLDFPLSDATRAYCIDDECVDEQVLACTYVLVDAYEGGEDSGLLLEAAQVIVETIRRDGSPKRDS